jgi:hypothetical protein
MRTSARHIMCNQRKLGMGSFQGVKFTDVCCNRKITSKFNPERTIRITFHSYKIDEKFQYTTKQISYIIVAELTGDVIIGLWRHLSAETTSDLF